MFNKTLMLAGTFAALVSITQAQTISNIDNTAVPLNKIRTGVVVQNSASVPAAVDVNAFENVTVNCQGTATSTSQTIAITLADGSTTSTTTVNCTTTMTNVMTFAASANGSVGVMVSPTAGLTAANTVKNVIVRKPTVYRP